MKDQSGRTRNHPSRAFPEDVLAIILPILLTLIMAGCVASREPAGAPSPARSPVGAAPVSEPWQGEWDKIVSGAKKEGKIVVAASLAPNVRNVIDEAFGGKYGITMEFISGKPTELAPKVLAERRAGLYSVDVFSGGIGAIDSSLAPAGVLESLDNVLILPDVLDKKVWLGGDLLWVDSNHYHVMFLAYPHPPMIINTEQVGNDEIKSYRDLLKPKWKGKIAFLDPTLPGGGRSLFMALGEGLMDKEYLRELGKQEPAISRDRRLLMEWVARGKYPIVIGISPDDALEFIRAGSPIKHIAVAEGTYVTAGGGGLALMKNAPHPNAARLFINWSLSREGQIVASKAYWSPSARNDVPSDFLDPILVRQPGVNYMNTIGIAWEEKREKYIEIAMELWGHLIK